MKIGGAVAVITGGARGLGRSLSFALVQSGCSVAVVDNSAEALQQTCLELVERASHPVHVSSHLCDVSDKAAVERLVRAVLEEHGRVSILINNAAIVVANNLEQVTWDELHHVVGVNIWGCLHCTKMLLPTLTQESAACVVNVSSLEGAVAIAGNLPYCLSKFAVRGMSEALSCDAQALYPHLHVLCVMPGFVRTNMLENCASFINPNALLKNPRWQNKVDVARLSAWFKRIGSTTPKAAAEQILAAIRTDRRVLHVGNDSVILCLLSRIFGSTFYSPGIYYPSFILTLLGVRLIGRKTIVATIAFLLLLRLRRRLR